MSSVDIKNLKIAKRYANALIESSKNSIDETLSALKEVNDVFNSNEEFKMFFKHPSVSLKDKKDTIYEIFSSKINQTTLDFLNVLLDENRFCIINTIYQVFQKEVQNLKNQQDVAVSSAIELSDEQKEKIIQKLSAKLNKEIILTCALQEDILGGLIIKINDKVIDLSLKTKFDSLRKYN